jgi:predicted hydrocarbon binding protein
MCFFSAGMLADFLGRLSGEAAAVMEVECRSRGDARCRFLSAMPETLQRVYEGMTEGRSYEDALGA